MEECPKGSPGLEEDAGDPGRGTAVGTADGSGSEKQSEPRTVDGAKADPQQLDPNAMKEFYIFFVSESVTYGFCNELQQTE